jgi:hypothetical protein
MYDGGSEMTGHDQFLEDYYEHVIPKDKQLLVTQRVRNIHVRLCKSASQDSNFSPSTASHEFALFLH